MSLRSSSAADAGFTILPEIVAGMHEVCLSRDVRTQERDLLLYGSLLRDLSFGEFLCSSRLELCFSLSSSLEAERECLRFLYGERDLSGRER